MKTCAECGETFDYKSAKKRFCSSTCLGRNKGRRRRETHREEVNAKKRESYRKRNPPKRRDKVLALFPEVIETWDFERNLRDLNPSTLSRQADEGYGSDFQGFWWKCSSGGHSYPMKIRNRLKGSGCPVCQGRPVPGVNDLFSFFPELRAWWDSELNSAEPPDNIRLGERSIEYWWRCMGGHEAFQMDARRARRSIEESIPLCEPCRMRKHAEGKSVKEVFPELVEYWSSSNPLGPEYFSYGSNRRVLWRCARGHEDWEATPSDRKFGKRLCPCCPGSRKTVVGCNDLATTHPEIAIRWDSERNQQKATEVKLGTNAKFYFKCARNPNHHPKMWLPNLRFNFSACTFCQNEPVACPSNDLACSAAATFVGWDWEKNADNHPGVNPHEIRPTDERVFFWKCPQGRDHSYPRSAYNKHQGRTGCTVCSNRVILPGENSLSALFPEIAEEWLEKHNFDILPLTPETAPPAGGTTVNWICRAGKGHAPYPSTIWNRTAGETGCPACSTYGYKRSLPGLLYFIERQDSEEHRAGRKIGISNLQSSPVRLRHWSYLGFDLVHTVEDQDGGLIEDLEKEILKNWIRGELGLGQWYSKDEMKGGQTETFSPYGPSNEEVIEKVNAEYERLFIESGSSRIRSA